MTLTVCIVIFITLGFLILLTRLMVLNILGFLYGAPLSISSKVTADMILFTIVALSSFLYYLNKGPQKAKYPLIFTWFLLFSFMIVDLSPGLYDEYKTRKYLKKIEIISSYHKENIKNDVHFIMLEQANGQTIYTFDVQKSINSDDLAYLISFVKPVDSGRNITIQLISRKDNNQIVLRYNEDKEYIGCGEAYYDTGKPNICK